MSWKEPCQVTAHYPLLDESIKMRPKTTGIKIMTLVYSKTGKSSLKLRIKNYIPRQIVAKIAHTAV
jgi:hypothetical protein